MRTKLVSMGVALLVLVPAGGSAGEPEGLTRVVDLVAAAEGDTCW